MAHLLTKRTHSTGAQDTTNNGSPRSNSGSSTRNRNTDRSSSCLATNVALFLMAAALIVIGLYLEAIYSELRQHKVLKQQLQGQGPASAPSDSAVSTGRRERDVYSSEETLHLITAKGTVKIQLLPQLSPESVNYVKAMVNTQKCEKCAVYSALTPKGVERESGVGVIQGMMANKHNESIVPLPTEKGPCPTGLETHQNKCPRHDPTCGCHGPIIERGMVAWSAGKMGPDWLISTFERPATWWGTLHTAWGRVVDNDSFAVLNGLYLESVKRKRKVHSTKQQKEQQLTFLEEVVPYTMKIVSNEDKVQQ
jgi:hypothetical protein